MYIRGSVYTSWLFITHLHLFHDRETGYSKNPRSLSLCVSINNITQIVTLLLTSGFGDGDVDDGVVLILLSLHSQVAGTS